MEVGTPLRGGCVLTEACAPSSALGHLPSGALGATREGPVPGRLPFVAVWLSPPASVLSELSLQLVVTCLCVNVIIPAPPHPETVSNAKQGRESGSHGPQAGRPGPGTCGMNE